MSWVAAVILLATGVFLPTIDVYSDLLLSTRLFVGNYYIYEGSSLFANLTKCETTVPPHPKFGGVMLAPLLVSWIFVTIQWFKIERGLNRKLKTLPLLVCQIYPQSRALQVLYYAKWKRHGKWQRMKEEWETGISHIGEIKISYL